MALTLSMKASLRALVAISIALTIYLTIHMQSSYWILLTVIALLPSTTGATFLKAVRRVVGTLAGVLLGFLCLVILPFNPIIYFILMGIILALCIYSSRFHYAIMSFFIGWFIIILLGLLISQGNPEAVLTFVIARVVDTFIGATIVVATAYWFWPDKSKGRFFKVLDGLFLNMHKLLQGMQTALQNNTPLAITCQDFDKLYVQIRQLEQAHSEIKQEPHSMIAKQLWVKSTIHQLHRLHLCFIAIYLNWDDFTQSAALTPENKEQLNLFLIKLVKLMEIAAKTINSNKNEFNIASESLMEEFLFIIKIMRGENHRYIESDPSISIFILNLRDIFLRLQFFMTSLIELK